MPDNFLKVTIKWLIFLIAFNFLTNYAVQYTMQHYGVSFLSRGNGLISFVFPFIGLLGFFLSTGLGIRELSRSNNYEVSIGSIFAFLAVLIIAPVIFSTGLLYYHSLSNESIANVFNTPSYKLSIFIGILFNFVLSLFVVTIASQWRIFRKAGYKGWYALVPIYNLVIMCDIVKRNRWWVLLFFIPLINLIALATITNGMARVFRRSDSFSIGLFFLPFIFFPILAFGENKYIYGEYESVRDDLDLEDHLVD